MFSVLLQEIHSLKFGLPSSLHGSHLYLVNVRENILKGKNEVFLRLITLED